MNKYLLRLSGGIALARWETTYEDLNMAGVRWFCERQFEYLLNIDEIQVFDASEDGLPYLGSFKRKKSVEWRQP